MERIRELESRIAELRERLPRHSLPPSMMMQLEELEDELARLQRQQAGKQAKEGPEDRG